MNSFYLKTQTALIQDRNFLNKYITEVLLASTCLHIKILLLLLVSNSEILFKLVLCRHKNLNNSKAHGHRLLIARLLALLI